MTEVAKIKAAIVDSIDSVARSMKGAIGSDEAYRKAEAIKTLVEAYNIMMEEHLEVYNVKST